MNYLVRLFKILLLVVATFMSITILFGFIKTDIRIILFIIVIGGGLTLLLDKLTSYEYKDSFQFIQKLEKYTHPKVRILWKLSKLLTYLMLLKIVSVDFLQFALDSIGKEFDSTRVLFDSALFTVGITGIIVTTSAMYRLEFKKTALVVDIEHPVSLSVELPNEFAEEELMYNMIVYYKNQFQAEEFFITFESKENLEDGTNWIEYSDCYFSNIELEVDMSILQREILTHLSGFKVEVIINKTRFKGYYKFIEVENGYLIVYIGALADIFNKNEARYLDVLNTLTIS